MGVKGLDEVPRELRTSYIHTFANMTLWSGDLESIEVGDLKLP